jgi:hypothetical protein
VNKVRLLVRGARVVPLLRLMLRTILRILRVLICAALLVRSVLLAVVLIRVRRICSLSVLVHSGHALTPFVMVLAHADISLASRPVALVWDVPAHHSRAPMLRLMWIRMETVLVTAMSVMGLVLVDLIILFVLVLLLHVAVLVPGLLTVVRLVLILLVPAGMRLVAVILAGILLMV